MIPAKHWAVAAALDALLNRRWSEESKGAVYVDARGRSCRSLSSAFGLLLKSVEIVPVADAVEVRVVALAKGSALHKALTDVLRDVDCGAPIRILQSRSVRL